MLCHGLDPRSLVLNASALPQSIEIGIPRLPCMVSECASVRPARLGSRSFRHPRKKGEKRRHFYFWIIVTF